MANRWFDGEDLFVVATGVGAVGAGRVRLRTLTVIRWIAIIGQTFTVLLVQYGIGFDLPILPCAGAVLTSAGLNIVLALRYPSTARLSDMGASLFLAYDLMQLGLLLALTGGLSNPFALLILVPVAISATVLSTRSTIRLGVLALILSVLLAFWHLPLPWHSQPLVLPTLYMVAIWVGLALGIVSMSAYAGRVAMETRRMSDALTAARAALAREQRLSALGGLAASAAHELGTPLGTIHLAARELAREAPPDSPWRDDLDLLVSQTERCRSILSALSRRPGDGDDAFRYTTLVGLVEAAIEPHLARGTPIHIEPQTGLPPTVLRSPEVMHGLANLVENAVDYAATCVWLRIYWAGSEITLHIDDDGPGVADDVLADMGEPYRTTRSAKGGMGLGAFISKTLLAHSGARVRFANRTAKDAGHTEQAADHTEQGRVLGFRVAIHWPRGIIDPGIIDPGAGEVDNGAR